MFWPRGSRSTHSASRMDITTPSPLPERYGVAIVAIAKNEELYIRDWLAFHSIAGVREIILYDNQSTDSTAEIAESFPGVSTKIIPWEFQTALPKWRGRIDCQVAAYAHAICTFGGRFRWMAFIDVDEFIVPRMHHTIQQALYTVSGFSNISLPWTTFGHLGHAEMPEATVPFAYDRCARTPHAGIFNFKCIVDPCEVIQVGVHEFKTRNMGNKTANMSGQVVSCKKRNESFSTNEILQLNRYYLKSKNETGRRIRKGEMFGKFSARYGEEVRRNARLIESDTVEDKAAIEFLSRHEVHSSSDLRQFGK